MLDDGVVRRTGIGGHQSANMLKDEWLTPPELLQCLGQFDLDPCAPINPPWRTAAHSFTILDNGLAKPWKGRVWMNPPYGTETATWMKRLADHGDGIALIFARTETEMFFDEVWGKAHALLFLRARLHFHHVDGRRAESNAGGPSVLVAYGDENVETLYRNRNLGAFIAMAPVNDNNPTGQGSLF